MTEPIRFEHVSKQYRLGSGQENLREALSRAAARILNGHDASQSSPTLWALRDVSFEVHPGEALGIVGPNGAGKTTTLKLLSRVTRPTSGLIESGGRIASLIELGAGFHPDLTGRENVYLNGAILGLSQKDIRKRFDGIVAFAELEEFIDTPVKRYSSGMYARLGFAVAAHVDPDILLVDEVLAVGDPSFQARCFKRIRELRERGVTMIIVSHQRSMIERNCTQVMILDRGQIVSMGEPTAECDQFFSTAWDYRMGWRSSGRREGRVKTIEITNVRVLDGNGEPRGVFRSGDVMGVEIDFRVNEPTIDPVFYSRLLCRGELVHGTNTGRHRLGRSYIPGDSGIARVTYSNLNLLDGMYGLAVGVVSDDISFSAYDHIDNAATIKVTSGLLDGAGTALLPHVWELGKMETLAALNARNGKLQ